MTEENFILRRGGAWNEFSALVRADKTELERGAASFIPRFREITQDLNIAKANNYDPRIIERLNALVNEGNQILYGRQAWPVRKTALFFLVTFPRKIRLHWRGILACVLIFYGLMFFFGFLCVSFPEISGELVPLRELASIESMYNPGSRYYLTPRDISNDADMFGYYIYNNISIAFRTFAGGIFAGAGSLLFMCINAGFLGIIAGHLINSGFSSTFFPFIIAHGAFELNAIVFSAYAGMLLGYRFFITNGLSRGASVKKAGQDAIPIIAGSALMLVIAAVIEAFWSSKHMFPVQLRVGSGLALWILILLYFLFAGIRRGESRAGNSSRLSFARLRQEDK